METNKNIESEVQDLTTKQTDQLQPQEVKEIKETDVQYYDIHVATDGPKGNGTNAVLDEGNNILHKALENLGLHDDNLIARHIQTDVGTTERMNQELAKEDEDFLSSCPLIAVHMSLKTSDKKELQRVGGEVKKLLSDLNGQYGVRGYYHYEVVPKGYDGKFERKSSKPKWQPAEFFCETPEPARLKDEEGKLRMKTWDIHVTMSKEDVDANEPMEEDLKEKGLYYISRNKVLKNKEGNVVQDDNGKVKTGEYVVFTIQGVGSKDEGYKFYDNLVKWLQDSGAPDFDAKIEITYEMGLVGNVANVPPVIDKVDFNEHAIPRVKRVKKK